VGSDRPQDCSGKMKNESMKPATYVVEAHVTASEHDSARELQNENLSIKAGGISTITTSSGFFFFFFFFCFSLRKRN